MKYLPFFIAAFLLINSAYSSITCDGTRDYIEDCALLETEGTCLEYYTDNALINYPCIWDSSCSQSITQCTTTTTTAPTTSTLNNIALPAKTSEMLEKTGNLSNVNGNIPQNINIGGGGSGLAGQNFNNSVGFASNFILIFIIIIIAYGIYNFNKK